MDPEVNDYSVEVVAHALVEAARTAADTLDEGEIVAAYLNHLVSILDRNCAIFYCAEGSPHPNRTPLRVHRTGKRELAAPVSVPRQTQAFIRNSPQQLVTSEDPAFARAHLRNLVLPNAAASLWLAVTGREAHFGTIVLLDESPRQFRHLELDVARTFALQLGHALQSSCLQKNAPGSQDQASSDLVRHLENAKLMSVVSRDLINPLTAMLGYIELLRAESLAERSQHYLEKLQGQVEKIQNIVMSLNAPIAQPLPQPPAVTLPPIVAAPRYAAPAVSMPLEMPPPVSGNRPRILVVQKNEALIEFQRSVLAGMMIDPIVSLTGADAVTLLQSEEVQAVILDDELDGEWPGRKLLSWIMANKPELSDRILLTVCSRPKADIRELIERSSIAYISKPLQMSALLTGVQQILGYQPAPESKFLH